VTEVIQRGGARSKLTPALADALVERVRAGLPMRTVVLQAGLNEKWLYDMRAAVRNGSWQNGTNIRPETLLMLHDFFDRVARAAAEWEAGIVENINEAGFQRNDKTGLTQWQAHAFLLKNGPTREQWFEHKAPTQLEVRRTADPARQVVRDLPDARLIELAGEDFREVVAPAAPPATVEAT
jgi:hypothetical protein